MRRNDRKSRNRRLAAALSAALLAGVVQAPTYAARKPNFGLYVNKYQRVVGTNEPFLEHPTGVYRSIDGEKWKKVRDLYTPIVEHTDDMDTEVLRLHEEGWVMIGYSAFSSSEAPESPLEGKINPGERAGTVIGLKMRGYDPYADPKGDPVDAAVWANATMVVVQEGYAFTRLETKKERILAADGTDKTTMRGSHRGSNRGVYGGSSGGSSNTSGRMDSDGDWDENHQDVSAGYDQTTGGHVEGSAGQSEGSSSDRTRYNENTNWNSRYAGGNAGAYEGSYDDSITTSSRHWATALVDKHVNHYDYMVTFWKKARVDQFVLGAFTETVPRELMREIGTRFARRIRAVVGGTPAYDADLWDGDVLLAIEGEPIRGEAGYGDLLRRYRGQEVTLTVWREGEIFDLPVELNDPR